MATQKPHLHVTVSRGGADSGHTDTFKVPAYDNQTVLDVVSWIQQNADPTLSYRFACRVGMCGSLRDDFERATPSGPAVPM